MFLQQDHNLLSQFGKKKFYCEVCAKGFSEENDLHYHKLDHITEKPLFICDDPVDETASEKNVPSEDNEVCQTYDETFTCEKCHKHFSTISCLKVHQCFSHFEYVPPSSCDHCGSHFKWKHHLAVHKYADMREKTSLCNTCSINSREKSCASDKSDDISPITENNDEVLDLSYPRQNPDAPIIKKHVCHLCQREFTIKSNLSRHMFLIHTKKRLFTHKYYNKRYPKKINIKSQVEIDIKKRPFICNICKKGFTHEGFLNRHLRLHCNGRLFCKVCHKAFFDNASFKQHMNIHSAEKLFDCHLCFKSFVCQNDLNYHLQNHSGEKPYPCDFCKKRFIRKRCLATHIMRLHPNQRPA